MGNIKKVMEKTAPALGLKYDAKRLVVYGNHRGFTTVIQLLQQSNNAPKVWISLMAATAQGTPLSGFEIQNLPMPKGVEVSVAQYSIGISVPLKGNNDAITGNITTALRTVLDYVMAQGGVNCDENGMPNMTEVWRAKGNYMILSPEGAVSLRNRMSMEASALAMKKENYVLGILGALAGSVVGALVIFLIARLGYVSMWAGVLLGLAVIFGYKKLAGKMSVAGLVICAVIALAMTYVAFLFDCATTLYFAWDGLLSFGECLVDQKFYYDLAGASGGYYGNLVLMMLFSMGGAIGYGVAQYQGQKDEREIYRLN